MLAVLSAIVTERQCIIVCSNRRPSFSNIARAPGDFFRAGLVINVLRTLKGPLVKSVKNIKA